MLSKVKSKIKNKHPDAWRRIGDCYRYFLIIKRPFYRLNPSRHWDWFAEKMQGEHSGELEKIYLPELNFLIKEIKRSKAKSVLEIGCGYGRILEAIAKNKKLKIKKLVGVDFSLKMLKEARKRLPKTVRLICTDARKRLPFEDKDFDLVFSWQSLMHVPPNSIKCALDELYRVAGKYILHGENLNVSHRTFRHDYLGYYKSKKGKILLNTKNPIRLRTKMKLEPLLFLKVKKRR